MRGVCAACAGHVSGRGQAGAVTDDAIRTEGLVKRYGKTTALDGVDLVDDVRLFGANPVTGERGQPASRVELPPDSLVFSYEHQVRVTQK